MIDYRNGDVLKVDRGIIVHGCNNEGVMGAGIALQIRNKFPETFRIYRDECMLAMAEGRKSEMLGTFTWSRINDDKVIVNLITQTLGRPGRNLSYDALFNGFQSISTLMLQRYSEEHLKTIPLLFPKIGAGLGGGDWDIISTLIDEAVDQKIMKICYVF